MRAVAKCVGIHTPRQISLNGVLEGVNGLENYGVMLSMRTTYSPQRKYISTLLLS
jgi:hypothetical protein